MVTPCPQRHHQVGISGVDFLFALTMGAIDRHGRDLPLELIFFFLRCLLPRGVYFKRDIRSRGVCQILPVSLQDFESNFRFLGNFFYLAPQNSKQNHETSCPQTKEAETKAETLPQQQQQVRTKDINLRLTTAATSLQPAATWTQNTKRTKLHLISCRLPPLLQARLLAAPPSQQTK